MLAAVIPTDSAARKGWLTKLRSECLCHRSRALVDLIDEALDAYDRAGTTDEKIKALSAASTFLGRMSEADKHAERMDLAALRTRAEARQRVADTLAEMH